MPEGDTLYRTAATLQRAIGGRVVTRFETAYAHLMVVDDQQPIAGRLVESVTAAGKHVLMRFGARGDAGGLVLRTHMRMHGSWHIYRPGEAWRRPRAAMRVLVETDAWVAVAFDVPVAEFVAAEALARHEPLTSLGPDLLGETFNLAEAIRRMREHGGEPMREVLLNQRVIAGIGNVYKSETLFVARLHPDTLVEATDDETLTVVLEQARRLLLANVKPGSPAAIVTYGGMTRETGRAGRGHGLWVYGRQGLPCRRCGTTIEWRKTGIHARSTYWCPECQGRKLRIL